MNNPLYSTLLSIRGKLDELGANLVLAESCTAGLVASELGQIPGISNRFCGSMVVYQTPTKTAWLRLEADALADPQIGPVSFWATEQMAKNLLVLTPQADISAAITGHLGPGSPPHLDGLVFFAAEHRASGISHSLKIRLEEPTPELTQDWEKRRNRQKEAARRFLEWIDIAILKS